MTVRILIGENEDLKELAEEFPQEASVIEEMLKAAESEDDQEDEEAGENATAWIVHTDLNAKHVNGHSSWPADSTGAASAENRSTCSRATLVSRIGAKRNHC